MRDLRPLVVALAQWKQNKDPLAAEKNQGSDCHTAKNKSEEVVVVPDKRGELEKRSNI